MEKICIFKLHGNYNSTYSLEGSYDVDISGVTGNWYVEVFSNDAYWYGQGNKLYITQIILH